MVYDLLNDLNNILDFVIIKKDKTYSDSNLKPFDKQNLLILIQKMEKEFQNDNYIKNKINEENFKNMLFKINNIKARFYNDNVLEHSNNNFIELQHSEEIKSEYETDSEIEIYEEGNNDIKVNETVTKLNSLENISQEQIMTAEIMILEELKKLESIEN
jgi:hypothetical protein